MVENNTLCYGKHSSLYLCEKRKSFIEPKIYLWINFRTMFILHTQFFPIIVFFPPYLSWTMFDQYEVPVIDFRSLNLTILPNVNCFLLQIWTWGNTPQVKINWTENQCCHSQLNWKWNPYVICTPYMFQIKWHKLLSLIDKIADSSYIGCQLFANSTIQCKLTSWYTHTYKKKP
jgi:hypothetical protein